MKFYGLLLLVLFVHCTAVQTSAETPLQLSGEIDRVVTPTHKPGPVWVFSLKRRALWNSTKDHLGSGGIFRIRLWGREPDYSGLKMTDLREFPITEHSTLRCRPNPF